MKNPLLALIPIVVSFSGPSSMSVAKCPLSDLTRYADAIFIGRVEEVVEIEQPDPEREYDTDRRLRFLPSIPVARVSVQHPLKGVEKSEVVYFPAMGTRTDDISTAVPGETALFFLDRSRWADDATSAVRSELKRRTGEFTTRVLSHSGRGRVPIRELEGEEYAVFRTEVVLPPELLTIADPDSGSRRTIPMKALLAPLRAMIVAQSPYFRAENRTPLSPDRCWQLEVWGDGFGRLRIEDPGGPKLAELTVDGEEVDALKQVLSAMEKTSLPPDLGRQGPGGSYRSLDITLRDGSRRSVVIHSISPELLEEKAERRRAITVLELWSELRGLFDTERTLDFRPHDRRCLEAWR